MNEIVIKNPLTNWIRNSIVNSKVRLYFAFPFLSSFAKSILNEQITSKVVDKRIITRFNDNSLTSFDLYTLKFLLDLGFKIQYNNSIHLKLYIVDNDAYITSSNFTEGGFENNVELSVKVDSDNVKNCINIFNEIWENPLNKDLTYELINDNWAKYEFLRKKESYKKDKKDKKLINDIEVNPIKIGQFDLQKIIDEIFKQKIDFQRNELVFDANKRREETKKKLMKGFNRLIFYAPEGHELRRENLFYDFVYGSESKLTGTGLRELQFKTVFEHNEFEKVVNYIFPEMLGMKPWNLGYKDEFLEFCNEIFNFKIPHYSESLPICLASYFYPDYYVPIFKLDHLRKICEILGFKTNGKTQGDKLFEYNSFLTCLMKTLPFNNYVKSTFAYQILYTVELYYRLSNGEVYENILVDYKKIWIKDYLKKGKKLLTDLKMID